MEDNFSKRYKFKLISNIINAVINVFIVAIVPKEIGPAGYGQFVYLQQVFGQITSLLDSGTSTAFFTKLSAQTTRQELIKFYFFYSLLVLFVMFIFILSLDFLDLNQYLFPEIDTKYIYIGCVYGFMIWHIVFYTNISDAYAITVQSELIKITHKIATIIILLLLAYIYGLSLYNYFWFNNIMLVAFVLFMIFMLYRKNILDLNIIKIKYNFKSIIQEFKVYSSPLLVFNIFSIIFSFFDIWLLQTVAGSEQTGFYGIAYAIAAMCFIFTSSMTPVITREFAKHHNDKTIDEVNKIFMKYIPMMYFIAAYFGIFVSFNSQDLLTIFTDEKFSNAVMVVTIMALYPIHQTYGQLSGSVFYVTGQTKLIKNIGIFAIVLGLFLSLYFIFVLDLGALGMAMKMVIVQFIAVNIQLYFNSKYLNISFVELLKHQVKVIGILYFFIYCIDLVIPSLDNILIEFVFKGICYTVLVIFLIILNPSIIKMNKKQIEEIYELFTIKIGKIWK